jgi:hypothetical protein
MLEVIENIFLMGIVLGSYVIFRQRRLWIDIGLLLLMLLASPWLINFLNDVLNPYTVVAADCEGHLTMSYRGIEGFLLAPIWTVLVGFGYLFKREGKHLSNRLVALICLLLLLMSVISAAPLLRLRERIAEMRPEMRFELPPGCR